MTNDFSFENCPVGMLNKQEIAHTTESLSKDLAMAIEKIEGKIDSMNTKMDVRFDSLDNKIDKLDKQFRALDEKMNGVDDIKSFVQSEIDNNTRNKVFEFCKWIVVVVLGSGVVTIVGKLLLNLLHLN